MLVQSSELQTRGSHFACKHSMTYFIRIFVVSTILAISATSLPAASQDILRGSSCIAALIELNSPQRSRGSHLHEAERNIQALALDRNRLEGKAGSRATSPEIRERIDTLHLEIAEARALRDGLQETKSGWIPFIASKELRHSSEISSFLQKVRESEELIRMSWSMDPPTPIFTKNDLRPLVGAGVAAAALSFLSPTWAPYLMAAAGAALPIRLYAGWSNQKAHQQISHPTDPWVDFQMALSSPKAEPKVLSHYEDYALRPELIEEIASGKIETLPSDWIALQGQLENCLASGILLRKLSENGRANTYIDYFLIPDGKTGDSKMYVFGQSSIWVEPGNQ